MTEQTISKETKENKTKNSMIGFILGLVGVIAWIIPLLGFPVTIAGLIFSIRELKGSKKGLAITGIVLNIFFLVLTIINSAIGAYLGATGQLFN